MKRLIQHSTFMLIVVLTTVFLSSPGYAGTKKCPKIHTHSLKILHVPETKHWRGTTVKVTWWEYVDGYKRRKLGTTYCR